MNHQFTSQCYRWYVIVGYYLSSVRLNTGNGIIVVVSICHEHNSISPDRFQFDIQKNLFFRQNYFLFINICSLQVWYNHYNHSDGPNLWGSPSSVRIKMEFRTYKRLFSYDSWDLLRQARTGGDRMCCNNVLLCTFLLQNLKICMGGTHIFDRCDSKITEIKYLDKKIRLPKFHGDWTTKISLMGHIPDAKILDFTIFYSSLQGDCR